MKTSKIKIRPFIPCLKDEEKEGREPFAILKYGNVTVELDYTIIQSLTIDNHSLIKATSIGISSFREIMKEMVFDMTGVLPNNHRDCENRNSSITHDPLHPSNEEITVENFDKCPECGKHTVRAKRSGGVECVNCDYWFCY